MLAGKRELFRPFTDGVGKVFIALRLKPDHITWLSVVIAGYGSYLVATGQLIAGSIIITVGASFDFVDGTVARLTDQVTMRGGYLDSLLDRFVDFFVVLSMMVHVDEQRAWIVGSAALFGSVTTSFAKARVFQDIKPPASVWSKDLLERAERYVIVLPGIFAQGILESQGKDIDVLFWVLVALAILSNLTVLQRMRTAMRVLREADGG